MIGRCAHQRGHGRRSAAARISRPSCSSGSRFVEGPRSAIYGTDAIGGVVNFITPQRRPLGADVMLD